MARSPTSSVFADQSTERTIEQGIVGMNWMRTMAEQSLSLSKAAFEGYLTTARKTADSMHQQASEIREQSISLASEALSNTFDFADRVVRVKEPQEILRLQSEFLSRQVKTLTDRTNELRQIIAQGANAATAAEQIRSAAE
jgi:hypothetical protein